MIEIKKESKTDRQTHNGIYGPLSPVSILEATLLTRMGKCTPPNSRSQRRHIVVNPRSSNDHHQS